MTINVLMPEPGTLLKWNYVTGDSIKVGDLLCEIETDKTVMEIEAEAEGVLQRILVEAGTDGIAAGESLAVLVSPEERQAETALNLSSSVIAAAKVVASASAGDMPPSSNVDRQIDSEPGRVFSSPLARRLARESAIEIQRITGTGPEGRIVERDVISAIAEVKRSSGSIAEAHSSDSAQRDSVFVNIEHSFTPGSYEEVPLNGMRRKIAERLLQSKQTIPHFYLSTDIELDPLIELRKQLNGEALRGADGKPRYQISVNDLVVKALAMALQEVSPANAVWAGDKILRFKHVDVGVAVALDEGEGLLTPVIRNADQKTLAVISNEIREFAARARSRKLQRSEYEGGVSSVSNLGMYGVKQFAAIINPPQSSILAVGAGEPRVVARSGTAAVAMMMSATLSCDHRVIDGVLGAQLLAVVKRLIEAPANLLI
jgi:pyruvate dehydrogenase E2 component (dihydrolipoamide acetyltransferase)